MNRKPQSKFPKETLVTDQPGRKVFVSGLIVSLIVGFFFRGLTSPAFIQSELKQAVSKVHESTQMSWSQASFSLKDGWWPRLSILIQDVKIISSEACWGQPILYSREVELPLSLLRFFEKGQPLEKLVIRDSFLEFKSDFICEKKQKPVEVKKEASTGLIRLKTVSETTNHPPLVIKDFVFENLKLRQAHWIYPDWEFSTLRLDVKENNPWYAQLDAQFFIPETEGVDTGARLSVQYKEFPSQFLDVNMTGHWREGTFKISGNWLGANQGWNFKSEFHHFPFQFLKSLAEKTKTPWNWPEKPMWFSFQSESPQPFLLWKSSQHLLKSLKIEGDLGEIRVPDLQVTSFQPFKVQPFVFTVENADVSTILQERVNTASWIQTIGVLSGNGQWMREDEFSFKGQVENTQVVFPQEKVAVTQTLLKTQIQADLNHGQWKILFSDFQFDSGKAQAELKLEGRQNLSSGELNLKADIEEIPLKWSEFLGAVAPQPDVKVQVKAGWADNHLKDFSAHLGASEVTLQRPLEFFSEELKTGLTYPLSLGKTSLVWSFNRDLVQKWQLTAAKASSRGEINTKNEVKGQLTLGGRNFNMQGTGENPILLLRR